MKQVLYLPVMAGTFVAAVTTGAVAQSAAETTEWNMIQEVITAFRTGNPTLAVMLALVLLAAIASKYGAKRIPWFASSAGRAVIVLVGAFGGAGATALAGGASWSMGLAASALAVAVKAAGGYSLFKALVFEPLKPYLDRLPQWAKAPLSILMWVFDKPSVTERAETAGNTAVDRMSPNKIEFQDLR